MGVELGVGVEVCVEDEVEAKLKGVSRADETGPLAIRPSPVPLPKPAAGRLARKVHAALGAEARPQRPFLNATSRATAASTALWIQIWRG